jgi:GNAT superfamily N-acetyltransferase
VPPPGSVPLAEDRGHDEELAFARGRVREHIRRIERRPDDVVTQDVLELDRLRRRRDVVGGDRGEDRVLVEDVVQLALEPAKLLVGEPEPGEVGDMLDVGARQGAHAPDDSRDMPTPRPRPMTPADIEPASRAILADDWGDRRTWFEFAVSHGQCRVFVAEGDDGSILGTGVATINGPVAWIGTIWVASSARGRGIGRALTEAPIEASEAAGCRTLVLVATEAGRPLYERLGFRVQTWYRTMEAPGLADSTEQASGGGSTAVSGSPAVRAFAPGDLDALAALDRTATGEDRGHLLAAFATPETASVVTTGSDTPTGFVVRAPWGGGATIARDPRDALAILRARRLAAGPDRRVRAGILLENEAGAAALAAEGWTEAWQAPRLVRGEPLAWLPEHIWGQFNHAVG